MLKIRRELHHALLAFEAASTKPIAALLFCYFQIVFK
jgi:hypothetical protein